MTKYEAFKKMQKEIDELEGKIESKYKDLSGDWCYNKYYFFKCAENVLNKLKETKVLRTVINAHTFDNKVIDFYEVTGEYSDQYKILGEKVELYIRKIAGERLEKNGLQENLKNIMYEVANLNEELTEKRNAGYTHTAYYFFDIKEEYVELVIGYLEKLINENKGIEEDISILKEREQQFKELRKKINFLQVSTYYSWEIGKRFIILKSKLDKALFMELYKKELIYKQEYDEETEVRFTGWVIEDTDETRKILEKYDLYFPL